MTLLTSADYGKKKRQLERRRSAPMRVATFEY
jgi:hypothetical protein